MNIFKKFLVFKKYLKLLLIADKNKNNFLPVKALQKGLFDLIVFSAFRAFRSCRSNCKSEFCPSVSIRTIFIFPKCVKLTLKFSQIIILLLLI